MTKNIAKILDQRRSGKVSGKKAIAKVALAAKSARDAFTREPDTPLTQEAMLEYNLYQNSLARHRRRSIQEPGHQPAVIGWEDNLPPNWATDPWPDEFAQTFTLTRQGHKDEDMFYRYHDIFREGKNVRFRNEPHIPVHRREEDLGLAILGYRKEKPTLA